MTFGHEVLDDFLLEPGVTYLNHGTVGVAHRAVFDERVRLLGEIERNPARFQLRELADPELEGGRNRLREAMLLVAPFVGARPADTVFVDNITTAANAVLRSFPLRPGDEIVVTSLGYGGVSNAAVYAARERGARCRTIELPWPAVDAEGYVAAVVDGLGPDTRILVVDHLTATTAVLLPLKEIAKAAHERGVLVFADGAHVPGNVPLDIAALGVDWYAANLHKWAFAPRSVGILWCAAQHQAALHANVISWGFDHGMEAEFHLPGTRDQTPALVAPYALDVMRGYGLSGLYDYNHGTVWEAARRVSAAWQTTMPTPEAMIGAMATVALPARAGADADDALRLRRYLNEACRIEAPVTAINGSLWVRMSCQIYNDAADFDLLADAVVAYLRQR